MSIALLTALPCPAAQDAPPEAATIARTLVAAVLDFSETGGYEDRLMGRRAAEWTYQLLKQARRWKLVPRADCLAQQRRLALTPPLEVGQLQRLADILGANLVVSGAVWKVAFNYEARSISVQVRVELTDAACGELLASGNGACSVRGDPRAPRPTDELVEKALKTACASALAAILKSPQTVGHIVAAEGKDHFRANVGRKQAMAGGRRLIIARKAGGHLETVAVAVVRRVAPDYCVLAVVAGDKVRLADLVIAP